jgi:hypothetical protein
MSNRSDQDAPFWALAQPVLARPGVTRSTMMGYPCLRLNGDFFASWDHLAQQLVVKLDQESVAALIDTGHAMAFAPSDRPFRQWAAIPATKRRSWPKILDDAYHHARRRQPQPRPGRSGDR